MDDRDANPGQRKIARDIKRATFSRVYRTGLNAANERPTANQRPVIDAWNGVHTNAQPILFIPLQEKRFGSQRQM